MGYLHVLINFIDFNDLLCSHSMYLQAKPSNLLDDNSMLHELIFWLKRVIGGFSGISVKG